MQNPTGQSEEPASGGSRTSVQDFDLGRKIYARYGNSPGVIPTGIGLASQVLRFSDRLPMLHSLHQRWSGAEGASHHLRNLQSLSGIAWARPSRSVRSILRRKVTGASPLGVTTGSTSAGEPHPVAPSEGSSRLATAGSAGRSLNSAAFPANVEVHSPGERAETPILYSANDRTATTGEMPPAEPLPAGSPDLQPIPETANQTPRISPAGLAARSSDEATMVRRSESVPSRSKQLRPPLPENALSPVSRSAYPKTGRKVEVRSRISELAHRDASAASTSGKGDEPHRQQSGTASAGEPGRQQVGTVSAVQPPVRDVHPEIEKVSLGHAVSPAHTVPTYIAPPIFRRSPGGAQPPNLLRASAGSHGSPGAPAGTGSSGPAPSRVLPVVNPGEAQALDRSESQVVGKPLAEKPASSQPASPATHLAGQPGEPFPPPGNSPLETASMLNRAQAGGSELQHSRTEDPGEATLRPAWATHSQSPSRVLQASAMIERSINRPVDRMATDTVVEHPLAGVSTMRQEGTPTKPAGDAAAAAPTSVQPLILSRAGSSRPAAGSQESHGSHGSPEQKVHNQAFPRLAARKPASPDGTYSTPESSLLKPAPDPPSPSQNSLLSPSSLSGFTPVSPNSDSGRVQRRGEASIVHRAEAVTNLRPGGAEVHPLAAPRPLPLMPLESSIDPGAVDWGHRDQPSGDGKTIDPMTAAVSNPSESQPIRTEGGGANSVVPVLRSLNTEQRVDSRNAAAETKPENRHAPPGPGTGTTQSTAASLASRIVPVLNTARHSQVPVARQVSLPPGRPSSAAVDAVPQLHRFARFSASESVTRPSGYGLEASTGSFRSSILTHRAGHAVDTLQRLPEVGRGRPAPPMNIEAAHQVVARTAGGGTGVPAANLPTATSPASRNPQGLKKTEISQLANRVYDLLVRRLASERQRRGQ
jgi:hypothetical protein